MTSFLYGEGQKMLLKLLLCILMIIYEDYLLQGPLVEKKIDYLDITISSKNNQVITKKNWKNVI